MANVGEKHRNVGMNRDAVDAHGDATAPAAGVNDHLKRVLCESESDVREELAELEHLYATAPVGLCVVDKDLRILRMNKRLAAMDGLPVADHIGRTVWEVLPAVAEVAEPVCRAVIESGEPVLDVELLGVIPARPSIVGLVSFYPLKTDEGAVKAVSVVVQDITARKRAEQALQESEARLSSILESAMDAIVTIDERRTIKLFNSAAEAAFRCTASEAIGTQFDRFASQALHELLVRCMRAFGRSGTSRRYMWAPEGLSAVRANDEPFPVEATISQAVTAGQKLYTIILRDVNDRKRAEEELRKLELENVYLREEVKTELEFEGIVGTSEAIRKALGSVRQVAETDSTVLVTGETGTGKELIARAIHSRSERKGNRLVKVNCAALPGGLIESELFGHEKGAFTGALSLKIGRFELADGGTIFLDEIGDLQLELQAKLLRVLQDGEFERVGGTETLNVDVRVIAATNRNLQEEVDEQRFRPDLYYRLNVFPIQIPPLRDRPEDIALLARHFAMKYAAKMGKRIDSVPQTAIEALMAYRWPGNVRELQNVLERAVIISRGPQLELGEWPPIPATGKRESRIRTLEDVERHHIVEVLDLTNWQVSGEKGAARILGMKPTTLDARMSKLGIKKPT